MIKEKEVNIKIVGRTKLYYQNLGYLCSADDNIFVKIEDLPKNSHVKITAICDCCGKEKIMKFGSYNKSYKKYNFYSCNSCKQVKIEKTNIEKYGCKRPIQNKNIRTKLEKTTIKKYGYKVSSQNKDVMCKIKKKQIETLFKKYNFLNIVDITKGCCKITCEKNHIFEINFSLLNSRLKSKTMLCTICNPVSACKSGLEIQLKDFVYNNYIGKIIYNSRSIIKPYELDIYLPDIKFAIEFNGLYWHCDLNKPKDYHLMKTEMCEELGIELFHIFEDEWIYKQEIIKSMILEKINEYEI